MDLDRSESRWSRYEDRDDMEVSPVRKHGRNRDEAEDEEEEGLIADDRTGRRSSRDMDKKKSSRGEERDRERDRDREHRGRDRERSDRERERGKDRSGRDSKEKEKDRRERDKDRERDRAKVKERDVDRDRDRDRERERGREKTKEREKEKDGDDVVQMDYEEEDNKDAVRKRGKVSFLDQDELRAGDEMARGPTSSSGLEERISKLKEERLKKNSEVEPEVLAWVNKSRKLEEKKNAEKEKKKAKHLSKIFEEQDNIGQGDSEDEDAGHHRTDYLSGVKVLHGLEKVMEGGAVVLTLKDQSILAAGDINQEVDMLENVEIGEQKRRDDAYKAAKKKTGVYDDKFNDDPMAEKKMLPQYDDPNEDEGVTLDERGRFAGEAEKKLEELRRRLQGASGNNRFEDLTSSLKTASDYYTSEEMLQFKKPKKKKSLRKKDKLDIAALEAEALSSGLGVGDLGSRNDGRRQALRKEQEKSDADMRNSAYQSAYAKADEASKLLRLEHTLPSVAETDEYPAFADDDEDLHKSLKRARELALKKQEKEASGPQAIARLASMVSSNQGAGEQNLATEESQENKIVFTEVEEFVWGLQLDEDTRKPDSDDVFKDEDDPSSPPNQGEKMEDGEWMEVVENDSVEKPVDEDKEDIGPDETLHEVPVGKGLSGALSLLKERGALKETIDWGGRNMDKKKSKLVGIVDDDAPNDRVKDTPQNDRFKDLRIDRTDEFGRIMTPKEAFRWISHKFHGKGPGKMKQEKRMKQYQEELKLKQMKNSDTPSSSVERMRDAQAQMKTPYLVLSGHAKTGQTMDGNGFGTVEKDLPGGLTPMLGDKKVDYFLGIKRKAGPGSSSGSKKPKS